MPFRSSRKAEGARLRLRTPSLLLLILVLMAAAAPAGAAERSVSDVVLVDQGAVIDDDLYAAGNQVVVEGRVNGDLIVAAYQDVTIRGSGEVTGDLLGMAGSVLVAGTVGESVRVVSPRVEVTGEVGRDVMLVAWDARLASDVGGEAVIWAWAAETAGSIGDDLEGQIRTLTLGGQVGGNVDVTVDRLAVREGTEVGSDLGYRSARQGRGVELAEVGGTVVHRLPLAPNIRVRALVVLAKLVLGLMAAVVGLLVMWALPATSERVMAATRLSWWRAWLRGLGVMVLPVLVVGLAGLLVWLAPPEAGLPLLAVLVPMFLAILGAVLALAFVSPVAAFPWLGRLGGRQRGPVRAFLYGAAAVILAGLVPWVPWAIALFVIPLGMGGWLSPAPSPELVS